MRSAISEQRSCARHTKKSYMQTQRKKARIRKKKAASMREVMTVNKLQPADKYRIYDLI